MKPIVYTVGSSGIRLGSWDSLQWKHVETITKENGKLRSHIFYDTDEYSNDLRLE